MFMRVLYTCIALTACALPASAVELKCREVKIVAPFPAGNGTDVVARIIAPRIAARIGRNVIIENRPGAFGQIGASAVAKAEPNGCTIGILNVGPLILLPSEFRARGETPPYEPDDFTPIVMTHQIYNVLVVADSIPVRTLPEFAAYARAHPNLGVTSGFPFGSFVWKVLRSHYRIELNEIPAKAGGEVAALTSILAGDVPVGLFAPIVALPHIDSGKLRPLAIFGSGEFPPMSYVPNVKTLGIPEFKTVDLWGGLFGPKNLPGDIRETLSRATLEALNEPETIKGISGVGFKAQPGTGAALGRIMKEQYPAWIKVMQKTGS